MAAIASFGPLNGLQGGSTSQVQSTRNINQVQGAPNTLQVTTAANLLPKAYFSQPAPAATVASNTGVASNTATGSGSGTTANYAAAGAYDNQASQYQNQYNQLDGSLNTGLSNLQNQYNTTLNDLNDNNAIAKRNYDTSVAGNTTNYLNTKNGIFSNTRSNANALQRLLGLAGAGNSSAASEQAPYAAALQGSTALNGANTTYATNQANLDTSYGDTQRAYKKQLANLDQNRFQQTQNLQSQIAQNRINLLNQISGAKQQAGFARGQTLAQAQGATQGYQNQINDLLGKITSYGNNYANPVTVDTGVSYKAPTLSDYQLGNEAIQSNGQAGAEASVSPTFLNLLASQREKNPYNFGTF